MRRERLAGRLRKAQTIKTTKDGLAIYWQYFQQKAQNGFPLRLSFTIDRNDFQDIGSSLFKPLGAGFITSTVSPLLIGRMNIAWAEYY
eukprot:scaffold328880_cov33-Prasinocladus_malaysianus.AAC.1